MITNWVVIDFSFKLDKLITYMYNKSFKENNSKKEMNYQWFAYSKENIVYSLRFDKELITP